MASRGLNRARATHDGRCTVSSWCRRRVLIRMSYTWRTLQGHGAATRVTHSSGYNNQYFLTIESPIAQPTTQNAKTCNAIIHITYNSMHGSCSKPCFRADQSAHLHAQCNCHRLYPAHPCSWHCITLHWCCAAPPHDCLMHHPRPYKFETPLT